ncbi:MAG: hypothetical protein ACREC6_07430 [Hyphomicrobiaceae bacterium]
MTASTDLSASQWYPPNAMRRGRVAVRVQWNGREFVAIRLLHPKEKRWRWATYRNGEIVWLPPRHRAAEWGGEPQCWQPCDAAAWRDPLPDPIAGPLPPRLARPGLSPGSEAGRDRRVLQAEAADRIRADIEAEIGPDIASPDGRPSEQVRQRDTGWWRDPAAVGYEPEGQVSLRMAEARVLRAVAVAGNGTAGVGPRHRSTLGPWMDAVAAAFGETIVEGADGSALAVAVRFEPTPRDTDDWLTAMTWFTALNPPELRSKRAAPWSFNRLQQLLVWRAMTPPVSWARIGRHIGRSRTRAGQLYAEAVDKVWRTANGLPVYKHAVIADQLALLRARNRAYRTAGDSGNGRRG